MRKNKVEIKKRNTRRGTCVPFDICRNKHNIVYIFSKNVGLAK